MSTQPQVIPSAIGTGSSAPRKIILAWDGKNRTLSAATVQMNVGDKIQFSSAGQGPVRVEFFSRSAATTVEMKDPDICTFSVGGLYPFRCFITPNHETGEVQSASGGVVDIHPHPLG
jgi:hypothetical protein